MEFDQKDREELLAREAQYQDSKITNHDVRREQAKYYQGDDIRMIDAIRMQMLGNVANKELLDYGCGQGDMTLRLLKDGAKVTAIDISPESVRRTQEQANSQGYACSAMVMDAVHTTFADATFDLIVGKGILHHLSPFADAIEEILRILKPGGRALFQEPLGMNPLLNLYRRLTPNARTQDERPFRMRELLCIKNKAPRVSFMFFDCFVLGAKLLQMLKLRKLAELLTPTLELVDQYVLNRKSTSGGITFFDRRAWMVLLLIEK